MVVNSLVVAVAAIGISTAEDLFSKQKTTQVSNSENESKEMEKYRLKMKVTSNTHQNTYLSAGSNIHKIHYSC